MYNHDEDKVVSEELDPLAARYCSRHHGSHTLSGIGRNGLNSKEKMCLVLGNLELEIHLSYLTHRIPLDTF